MPGLIGHNLVILVVAPGFGLPIIIQRNMRFTTVHLLATAASTLRACCRTSPMARSSRRGRSPASSL